MSDHENRQLNWHPNFRIESTLPDTRVIRTNFLLKVLLYTIILILIAFISRREYEGYILRQTIDGLEQQVQNSAPENRLQLKKSEQFRKLAGSIKEVQQFFQAPLAAHESIVDLASVKPEELRFTSTSLSEIITQVKRDKKSVSEVNFKLAVSGEVQDLAVLTQFKRELEEFEPLNPDGYVTSIDEVIEQRDVDTGTIPFKLTISFKTAK